MCAREGSMGALVGWEAGRMRMPLSLDTLFTKPHHHQRQQVPAHTTAACKGCTPGTQVCLTAVLCLVCVGGPDSRGRAMRRRGSRG